MKPVEAADEEVADEAIEEARVVAEQDAEAVAKMLSLLVGDECQVGGKRGCLGSVLRRCGSRGVERPHGEHLKVLYTPLFAIGTAVAVRAQGNQVRNTVLVAFIPRDNVGLLKRQRIAANRAVVSRLEKNFAANLNWNCWAVVAHL